METQLQFDILLLSIYYLFDLLIYQNCSLHMIRLSRNKRTQITNIVKNIKIYNFWLNDDGAGGTQVFLQYCT